MTGLERMQAMIEGKVPPPPIAGLVGMELVHVEHGQATFALTAGPQHANPMGTLHGGILCDLGDAAMGCAVGTTLEEGESFTSLELKINFFKPIWTARLTCVGKVLRRTRRTAYTEAEIQDPQGSLVAKLNGSCLILSGEDARGR